MKRLRGGLWGAVMLLCVFSGIVHGAGSDLSGVWIFKENIEFRVVHKGSSVKFYNDKGWREAEEPPGYVHVYGNFDGRNFVGGKLGVRLGNAPSNAYRASICGKNWKEYRDLRLTLSADGNTLSGDWLNQPLNEKTCQPSGQPYWVSAAFKRKVSGPEAKGKRSSKAQTNKAVPSDEEVARMEKRWNDLSYADKQLYLKKCTGTDPLTKQEVNACRSVGY